VSTARTGVVCAQHASWSFQSGCAILAPSSLAGVRRLLFETGAGSAPVSALTEIAVSLRPERIGVSRRRSSRGYASSRPWPQRLEVWARTRSSGLRCTGSLRIRRNFAGLDVEIGDVWSVVMLQQLSVRALFLCPSMVERIRLALADLGRAPTGTVSGLFCSARHRSSVEDRVEGLENLRHPP